MSVYLSAGVYPKEVDFSTYVASLATSIFGMVGVFQKGTIGEAQSVTSLPKAQAKYGSYIPEGIGMYALKAYFENGGGIAHVVRTAHYEDITDASTLTAKKAKVTLTDGAEMGANNSLLIEATSEGTWANGLKIEAVKGLDTFTLNVKKADGTLLRSYRELSLSVDSEDYVETRINGTDDDLKVTALSTTVLPNGEQALSGGDDGLTGIVDMDFIGDAGAQNGMHALTKIEDLNFFAIPGKSSPTVISAGLAYAEGRQDLLFLADTPEGLTVDKALEFRSGTGSYSHASFNSSYGALYYPYIKVADAKTGRERLLPPSPFVAGKIAYNDAMGGVWTAPAGLNRGVLQNVLGVERTLDKGERDLLYPNAINPIANFSDGGVVIWGQKTLQAKPSALDRVNVRRLMMHIEESIATTSKFLLFEQHTEKLRNQFVRMVSPYLKGLQDKGAFYDFKVQCDEEINTPQVIDNNQIYARVFVKPTKTAEFFPIDFAIAPTGANFEELF